MSWRIWRDKERTLRFALGSGGECVTLNDFGVGVFSYAICPAACETSVARTGWDSVAASLGERGSRLMCSMGTGQGGRSWRGSPERSREVDGVGIHATRRDPDAMRSPADNP